MTTKRQIRGKELTDQSIEDVLEDFYRLRSVIDEKSEQEDVDYIITRLVTILEQFFRYVVECSLEKEPAKIPSTIEMDPHIIDSVSRRLANIPEKYIRDYVVSLSYSFQNPNEIISMMERFKILNKQNGIKKMVNELANMFQQRHKVVHTVEQNVVNLKQIRKYHAGVECLMHEVLDKLAPDGASFYYLKGDVLRNFELRAARRKNFEARKHYHSEAMECYGNAFEYLEKRIKKNTRDIDAHYQLMELYIGIGNRQETEKCAKVILSIDPGEPWANYYMGMSLGKKNSVEALRRFKKAAKGDPEAPEIHEKLINVLIAQGKYAECFPCIDEAIAHLPYEPAFYMAKGAVFDLLNMPEYAKPYYKIADTRAIEFVMTFSDDVHGCENMLVKLQEFGRDDAIAKCRIILQERK